MLASKRTTLKPLLESKDGVHLTAFLVNRGNLIDLKSQLRTTISKTYEWLNPVMSADERKKFLEPLDSLLHDARIFKNMKGNIGIFRNSESFRVLNIPIDVEQSCQVATSFHVKPLLRWLQGDQEFLLLGLEKEAAHLYLGSQDSLKIIDSILYPEFLKKSGTLSDDFSFKTNRRHKKMETETFLWINDWVLDLTKNYKPKLFIVGEPSLVKAMNRLLDYDNAVMTPIANSFTKSNTAECCQQVRTILREESKKSLERALFEFQFAEEGNRTKKNIFHISRAVVQGKVRKLIVTDEVSIFGKIDHKSGSLSINAYDIDHEDDCILDDLAQMVLNQGGEVVIAKRTEIPKGRPILAIIDSDGESLEKTEMIQIEALQERLT